MNVSIKSITVSLWIVAGAQGSNAGVLDPKLVCLDGGAFVQVTTWDTGCRYPEVPYYRSLVLNSESPAGGSVDFRLGYTFSGTNPHCDNPRGMPWHHYLPLPFNTGEWDVMLDGELLGAVSFTTILPCRVRE